MTISNICTNFIKSKTSSKAAAEKDIIEFCSAEWGLGLGTVTGTPPLYPAQKFILKCYYGLELDGSSNRNIIINDQFNETERYRFNEIEYAKYLFDEGRINKPLIDHAFDHIVLVVGRRGGKTSLTSCIIAYEAYKLLSRYSPQEYFGIMPEDDIRLTCVSTSKETASELFNKVTGHLDRSEFFRRYRLESTKQSMYLQTQRDIEKYGRGKRATISIHVAPCSAKGVRGHGSIVIGLDEMAHFFEDEKAKGLVTGSDKNDRSIYNAITPGVAKFKSAIDNVFCGKIICISSPSIKSGKFYEEYERSFKSDVNDLLMIQAPSWELDPNMSSEYLRSKFRENPIVFRCEHGAAFDDRLKGWIEDPEVVRQNIVPGLRYKDRSSERIAHFMGIDIGLKNDGTAIVICHSVQEIVGGIRQNLLEIDAAEVRYASLENKSHFVPDEMADWIAGFTQKFYIIKGLMDQWYGMAIVPLLEGKGLKQFEYREFNENTNSTVFQNLLTHFISQTIRFPDVDKVMSNKVGDTELIAEILSLQAHQKSKYIIAVAAPERDGAHDDLSSALSRAVLLASDYKNKGYGIKFANVGTTQAKSFGLSRHKELMKMSLNRPSRGSMSARDMFSRSVYSSNMRTR
jgi:hypothetical protein